MTVYWIHFDYFNNKENRFARTADQSAFRKRIKTLAVITVLNSRYNSRKLGQADFSYDGFITVALDNPLITAHRYSFEHLEMHCMYSVKAARSLRPWQIAAACRLILSKACIRPLKKIDNIFSF